MSSPLLGWMAIEVSRKRDIKRVELYPTPALNPLLASGTEPVEHGGDITIRWQTDEEAKGS